MQFTGGRDPNHLDGYYTVNEYAGRKSIAVRTVLSRIKAQNLASVNINGHRYIPVDAVDTTIAKRWA